MGSGRTPFEDSRRATGRLLVFSGQTSYAEFIAGAEIFSMRLTIRYQLLLPLVTLLLGVAALSAWIAWSAADRARRQIEARLDGVAASVTAATFPHNLQTLKLMKDLSGADFVVMEQGESISTLPLVPANLPAPAPRDRLHLAPRVVVAGQTYFCQGVALRSEVGAHRVVYLFYPESLWREAVAQAVWPALIIGAIGGGIAVALTLLATQRITRRLRELVRRTRLIADGDFSPMPLGRQRDELADLGRAVNEMADRLAKFQETLRSSERLRLLGQVSGGLAHQLRNGVTGAKLAVQLHARTAQHAEEIDVALRQLTLVEMQLKRFLDLGKNTQLQLGLCDLGALIDDAVALLRPRCLHAGIELAARKPESALRLSADAHQLGQVILNLLTNAIEAAGPGGKVEACVSRTDGKCSVEIVDSGTGVDPQIAARLFEPFVTSKPEGVGLGLAVARQIVAAHGGVIRWERRAERTCFRVEFPRGAVD